jgi:hypothetical protein
LQRTAPPLRVALALLLSVLGLAALAIVVNATIDSRGSVAFERVEMGAPESAVVGLLGTPTVERPCGENLWWGGDSDYRGKNDGRCVSEIRYEFFLEAYGVGYSADRRVVSKYHYMSE